MPKSGGKYSGRSGRAGNKDVKRTIQIHTAHPDLLQPHATRPNLTTSIIGGSQSSSRKSGRFGEGRKVKR